MATTFSERAPRPHLRLVLCGLRAAHRSKEKTGGVRIAHSSKERAGGARIVHRSNERAGGASVEAEPI
ncbi:hypothetical protein [Aliidiomarina haloalkalitolerans]|uniref:Uncharacterized protein n=1 Tax=Aliidiomarina haloalkalitolerans TaxID=859059 RepID=A0A432VT13_9GAMM|nr:hypothetical protein [Aliidiomarina haloalkalitolerans]RUO19552.1 hypothetical protein CWE06_08455 [Aliidiomarina haloalkalitolerans]